MNRRNRTGLWRWLAIVLAAGSAPSGVEAAIGCPESTADRLPVRVVELPRFEADLCYFAESSTRYRVEVFVSICNDDLQFVKREERFLARYEITVIARDRRGKQVQGDQVRSARWVDTYEATNEAAPCPVERLEVRLPADEYRVTISLRDVDSEAESQGEQRIVLPALEDRPVFGSLKFLEGAEALGEELTGQEPVVVDRCYGDLLPVLRVYTELYALGDRAGDVELSYVLSDDEGRTAGEGRCRAWRERPLGWIYWLEHRTDSLAIGNYDLEIRAQRGDETVAMMCGTFSVLSSQALWARDFEEMLELLSYIATSDELDRLKNAPVEKRREAWEEFWQNRDAVAGTSRNEVREEFFDRVAYANKNFAEPMAEGWRTDRGRIYILEGPPDSIESHPMEFSTQPWEAWYYHNRGIVYIFVDRSGFGQYVLVGTR